MRSWSSGLGLLRWTTVVAPRWKRPAAPPLRPEDADEIRERFEQWVTAQRLRHIGVVGITVVWVQPIPTEVAIFANDREMLYARDVSTGFDDPLASSLGPDDGEPLRGLMEKLAVSDKKVALALRRFNTCVRTWPTSWWICGSQLRRCCSQTAAQS